MPGIPQQNPPNPIPQKGGKGGFLGSAVTPSKTFPEGKKTKGKNSLDRIFISAIIHFIKLSKILIWFPIHSLAR